MANKIYLRRRNLLTASVGAALIVIALTLAAGGTYSLSSERKTNTPPAQTDNRDQGARASSAQAAQPLSVSNSSSATELGRRIDNLIDEGEFKEARWGVFVMSLKDNRVLYARDARRAMAPASNLKLYTTAVALDLLGADYRWRTSLYAAAEPDKDGTLAGDLVLYGRGAPDFSSSAGRDEARSALDALADELARRNVRRVGGRIIGDESYFRGDPLGDGWLWNDLQWYFGAEVSALSINDNEINVSVTPSAKPDTQPAIKLRPETDYVRVENDARTIERDAPSTIGITRGLSDNNVRVWGDFPAGGRGTSVRLSVHQPALWAARLLRDALKRRGIAVEGDAATVDARDNIEKARLRPESAVELAFVQSKPLGEVIRLTNKESINLYAELILRTLGVERGMSAPDPDRKKMSTRGDDEAGLSVIRQWLSGHEVPIEELALHDGSGLSRLNLVTPEATARLLAAMTKTPSAEIFRDSLPVAGRDGTLKFRLRSSVAGHITAKTGTLTYINSLSGYVRTADDEWLAFSIICNDETEDESSTRTIDAIAESLALYSAL